MQIETTWGSYPSIYNVGHAALTGYFDEPVIVEEKVDGSQFSFGMFEGELKFRSKGAQIFEGAGEGTGMFNRALASVIERKHLLRDGWTYRGEYLQKPKHNSLCYSRIPNGHIILFDVTIGGEQYLSYADKQAEAERIGLECVPLIFEGMVTTAEQFMAFLETVSVLGGQKIEGVVCKRYNAYGTDKKVLLAKYVSEAFKEIHSKEWRLSNPTRADVVADLIDEHRTPARWNKALQHMREAGQITDSPRDIGPALKEIATDVKRECEDAIKDRLFKHFWPQISRGLTHGFPEYYKNLLVQNQFEGQDGQPEDGELPWGDSKQPPAFSH